MDKGTGEKETGENGTRQAPVVLFDGHCRFCNGWVRFVLRRDPAGVYRFAPLQSPAGRRLLLAHDLDPDRRDSVVLIDSEGVHFRSGAALRILHRLRAPWPALAVLRAVPPGLRNTVYDWVGARRYRWFGRYAACPPPPPGWRDRFLPDSAAERYNRE